MARTARVVRRLVAVRGWNRAAEKVMVSGPPVLSEREKIRDRNLARAVRARKRTR